MTTYVRLMNKNLSKEKRIIFYFKLGYQLRDKAIIFLFFSLPRIIMYFLFKVFPPIYAKISKFIYLHTPSFRIKTKIGSFYIRPKSFDFFYLRPDYEEKTTQKLLHLVKDLSKKEIFVDIGAHIGRYTIALGNKNKSVKIISIEAEKENYLSLLRNIKLNKLEKRTFAFNYAISEKEGYVDFLLDVRGSGSSHILSKRKKEKLSRAIKIPAITLEKLIGLLGITPKKIKLIKIDVEGHEFSVLKGMKKILRHKPTLVMEIGKENKQKVARLLKKISYKKIVKIEDENYFVK